MDHSQNQLAQLLLSKELPRKKSSQQYLTMIRYLFQSPKNMGIKFGKYGNPHKDNHGHNIDLNVINTFYQNIQKLKLQQKVTQYVKLSLQSLEKQTKLQQFIKNKQNIRYFFIIMLWNKLYINPSNNLNLLKFINLLNHLGNSKQYFNVWCDDIPAQFIKLQVQRLLKILQVQLSKLEPGVIDQKLIYIVQINIQNILLFLSVLYQSNKRIKRLQNQQFILKKINQYYKPIDIFKKFLNKQKNINLIKYPFLLDLDYKYRLLQIQSIFQQKINMQKNMHNGLQNLMNGGIQLDVNGNFSLEGLIYLHFQINRNNILNDSMEKLCKIKYNLKNPLRIKFIGEEGNDQGGVQNQYFQLLTKEIFNPYLDMFLPKNNGRVYWFNGFSYQPPIRFQFVGMLLGLAIYNSVHLHVRFPKMLYKKLLAQGDIQLDVYQLLEQLNQIQPQYYQSMKKILDSQQSLDQLQLYFTIEIDSLGQKITQQLVQDGSMIKLSQDNKLQYAYMFCEHLLNRHIEKQFRAFKKGFDRVVDTQLIKMFTVEELEVIICGNQVIDFHELQANTNYQGYTKDTTVIRNLWKILHSLNQHDKKAFLMFCTGSDRVPLGGLKSLKFVVQKHANSTHLPTAHTCFNVLLLPQYQSKQKLAKNIEFILKNNQGFGLI